LISIASYLALIAGAILGVSLRYLINIFQYTFIGLPISTIVVNIIGSLIAGIFLNKFSGNSYLLIYVGFLGSFTTLSSFNIEFFNLISNHLYFKSFLFFFSNIFVSFLFFIIGFYFFNKN
jgi:CrcB protein|tara:strand:- start:1053 stop:1412 length:360 start_codon:yes stop_codon:yes gene_type:complete